MLFVFTVVVHFASSTLANPAALLFEECTDTTPVTPGVPSSYNTITNSSLDIGLPLAQPCYSSYNGTTTPINTTACAAAEAGYNDEFYIAANFGGYINLNWGMCQANGQRCVLNTAMNTTATCYQGSVPSRYITVKSVSDVQKALRLANTYNLPLVVKNTGHDLSGRSSAPGSVALWTFPYKPAITFTRDFVPEGCSAPVGDGVTVGAGHIWDDVYRFAEANNVTVVGGSDQTVGAAGGWLTGGGHGVLSPTLGLGVDNVLQMKAVLPNGTYVTANRCQNQDIFFALRGGGGNAFGVNMEVTYRAHPMVILQVAVVSFQATNGDAYKNFFDLITKNTNTWTEEGWGGYIHLNQPSCGAIFFNPLLNKTAAERSMSALISYATSNASAQTTVAGVETFNSFFKAYNATLGHLRQGAGSATTSSRLIPKSLLATQAGQASVSSALANITSSIGLQILMVAPTAYTPLSQFGESFNDSSITPAWRSAAFHVTASQPFSNDADVDTIQAAFSTARDAMQTLRDLTPDSGAYQNEADVFEPDPVNSYWGQANYERLAEIKRAIDPNNVATCWGCIGWDPSDARYSCYPDIGVNVTAY